MIDTISQFQICHLFDDPLTVVLPKANFVFKGQLKRIVFGLPPGPLSHIERAANFNGDLGKFIKLNLNLNLNDNIPKVTCDS